MAVAVHRQACNPACQPRIEDTADGPGRAVVGASAESLGAEERRRTLLLAVKGLGWWMIVQLNDG